jgi:hypothetical protein
MRIELLGGAIRDLRDGVRFYDDQAEGLGRYFFDSLSADIDSLQLYACWRIQRARIDTP